MESVQISPGRLLGKRSLLEAGSLMCVTGHFNVGVRSCGMYSDRHVTLQLNFSGDTCVRQWSHAVQPGDIVCVPPGADHQGTYRGPGAYLNISLLPEELTSAFTGEARLADRSFWSHRQILRPAAGFGVQVAHALTDLITRLERAKQPLSANAAEFYRLSIVDAFAVAASTAGQPMRAVPLRDSGKLVRAVEHYLDNRAFRPVHISEVCSALDIPRRSLYRAFDDILGIGPVAFFRHKRLCAAHAILRSTSAAEISVTQVALESGFTQLGRFAQLYRALFDELPSQTRRRQTKPGS